MCRCPAARSNGAPATGGGGDASAFSVDFDAASNVVTAVRIAALPVAGAWALLRDVVVGAVFVAGSAPGDNSETFSFQAVMGVRTTASGSQAYGVPVARSGGVDDAGLAAPGAPGAAGIPVAAVIAANELVLNVGSVAIPGFTIRWRLRGQLWTFDGATRLVA